MSIRTGLAAEYLQFIKMKKLSTFCLLIMALNLGITFSSCSKGETDKNQDLSQENFARKVLKNSGNDEDRLVLYIVGQVWHNGWNWETAETELSFKIGNIFSVSGVPRGGWQVCDAQIVCVGNVSALSQVTAVPSSCSWKTEVAVQPGQGYIIRSRDGEKSSRTFLRYARVYVEKWVTGATGNIIGVEIQYDNNWLIDY